MLMIVRRHSCCNEVFRPGTSAQTRVSAKVLICCSDLVKPWKYFPCVPVSHVRVHVYRVHCIISSSHFVFVSNIVVILFYTTLNMEVS